MSIKEPRKFVTTDQGHADVLNIPITTLYENDQELAAQVESIKNDPAGNGVASKRALDDHAANADLHVTAAKQAAWNTAQANAEEYTRNYAAPKQHSHPASDLPSASTQARGIVQLNTSTSSPATDQAATPSAVMAAYNTANAAAAAAAAAAAKADQAFQAGDKRKAEVVAVLIAMGIPASTSESWESLIGKMTAISKGTMVSVRSNLSELTYKLANLTGPVTEDKLILTIPAGVTKLAFLSDDIALNSSGPRTGTYLFSRTYSATAGGGDLCVGLKDRNNNFCELFRMFDAYTDPMYRYLHSFSVDLAGAIPSFYITNMSDNNPGSGARGSISIPTNFDISGGLSLVYRSTIINNIGRSITITRHGDFKGTLLYA